MSSLDASLARALDKAADEDDEDALISALEDDEEHELAGLRERRLQQLHEEVVRAKTMRDSGTGSYGEVKDEKEVLDITTSTKLCVVHFFKDGFGRCGVMDRHLEVLARKHFDTRVFKVNVDNAPFLVTKLQVKVLPCVIAFIDGIGVDRIIGFEGLRGGDSFTTKDLEARLLTSGVLVRAKMENDEGGGAQASGSTSKKQTYDEDDDDDWD